MLAVQIFRRLVKATSAFRPLNQLCFLVVLFPSRMLLGSLSAVEQRHMHGQFLVDNSQKVLPSIERRT